MRTRPAADDRTTMSVGGSSGEYVGADVLTIQ